MLSGTNSSDRQLRTALRREIEAPFAAEGTPRTRAEDFDLGCGASRHCIVRPNVAAYRSRVDTLVSARPDAIRAMADCEVPIWAAIAV